MTTITVLMWAATYAQGALALAGFLAMVRILVGPRAQDRVLAIDAFYVVAMLLFIVTGMKFGTPFFFEAALVIGNTRASRSLASSAYNERRAECEQGVALLKSVLPGIQALRDVTSAQLETHRALLPENVYLRCRHVVSENERVLQTVAALQAGELSTVGALMNASHDSLRDDYEVSSPALDAMVTAMRSAPGCYGARLTGAGFGGCAVALVDPGQEQAIADAIFELYPKATNIWPEVYTTKASDGASAERLE